MDDEQRVIDAMLTYGGNFVQRLATLYQHGDPQNQRRLREAFPEYFAEYAEMVRMAAARKREMEPPLFD